MKFLLTTLGSLGDLHPYIAVGLGLRARGHQVTLGTSELYRAKVEGEGLRFHPIRPDMAGIINDPESIRKAFHPRSGTEYIVRRMFIPGVEEAFEDTLPAAREADLIVGHPVAYATPIAAEMLGKPWVSVALAPLSLMSAEDPPTISGAEFLEVFRRAGPGFWRAFWTLGRLRSNAWGEPVQRLRKKLGLSVGKNPVLEGTLSPFSTQAWFSKVIATRQRDWPANTTVTGFPFYDRLESGHAMSAELRTFLKAGPPPVVFTLGSSAVFHAGTFYDDSVRASRMAGVRAVLLTGRAARNRVEAAPDESFCVAEYAPYSELFPHVAAIVHQGGVGTTAQALRAGRPMLVLPYAHDQPDNARRVVELGVARKIPRAKYGAEVVAGHLRELMNPSYAEAARRVAAEMATEDGVRSACEKLEGLATKTV